MTLIILVLWHAPNSVFPLLRVAVCNENALIDIVIASNVVDGCGRFV
jgi:hypothetical protein